MRAARLTAIGAGIVMLCSVTACGGNDDTSSSASGATTLGVRSTTITVAPASGTPAEGTDGQTLNSGETLTTNGTGFGIVNYPDGSLTRLDKNAVFTLDSIGTSATQPQVKATLKKGQAWNRVQKITGSDGQYEITTPYGTVAVRGTTFNIDCTQPPGGCTITAIDGIIDITPLDGPALTLDAPGQSTLTKAAASPAAPVPATFTSSPWATTNTGLDAAATAPAASSTAAAASAGNAGSIDLATYDVCALTTPADLTALGIGPAKGVKTPRGATTASCQREGKVVVFEAVSGIPGSGRAYTSLTSILAKPVDPTAAFTTRSAECTPTTGPSLGDESAWYVCTRKDGRPGADLVIQKEGRVRLGDLVVKVIAYTPSPQPDAAMYEIVERIVTDLQK